ncbi:DUF5518 domain-containing protein [Halorhabdus salina]|uniref:DUF5518 domain-containing protein n=1 Tax=Halorhabdus salina TaxID=2750670 RepID=UPI0015EF394F|nr:DUF5518 domain-containing protein [Halorhabdus salina]
MAHSDPLEQTPSNAESMVVFDRLVDWGIAALLGVIGLLSIVGGFLLQDFVDRSLIADVIHDPEFQSDVLTEAEAIDAIGSTLEWMSFGLMTIGGVLVLIAVAVVVAHGRARASNQRTPGWILGVTGAIVGTVFSFVPLSPAIGGGIAGYLDSRRDTSGIGVGALAGLFAAVPAFVLAAFTTVGLYVGLPDDSVVIAVLPGVFFVVYFIYTVGASLVGGYVGKWIADD